MNNKQEKQVFSRRAMLGAGAALAGGALLGLEGCQEQAEIAQANAGVSGPYPLVKSDNQIYFTCLQCNTQCTLKGKSQGGVLVKIDGNPYSPMNMVPQIPYQIAPENSAVVDAAVCSKSQAGIQTLYDPYRLRKVLKRVGPRGANKWKAIPFAQAVQEITDGGQLFSDIGESRQVPGFKDVFVLRDAKLAKEMASDVEQLRGGKMTLEAFKTKHAAHLDVLIDPDHPDLGPKNNQFVIQGGRIVPDREWYTKRFAFGALGSVNWFAHTTVCEQAHHVAFTYALATWQGKHGKYDWVQGPNHMKPDYANAEFVIFWGTGFCEANFGPPGMAPRLTKALVDGNLKIAVIDPRLSKSATKGWWIPVQPGGDLALALGMIRWIIDYRRYDEVFLRNANKAAATNGGEKDWTNSTWLVDVATGKFLRAADVGVGKSHEFVALVGGRPVAVDPSDTRTAVVGDLDVETTIAGRRVASGFRMLKNSAGSHDLAFYAKIAGIPVEEIEKLAHEFTAHGKKAAIDFYRGPIKITHGYYAAQAIIALNFLIGNVDHVGGLMKGGGAWDGMGGGPVQPFPMAKLHPNALTPFGVKLTRESSGPYQTSTLFKRDGYPAKRPWFPFTFDVYQEIIPAAYAEYPYPIKILWLHYGTPALSAPAGHLQIKMLQDTNKIPLFIATDIVIGETSMYADYIFPDQAYPERWSNPLGASPVILTQISTFRQPAASPVTEIVNVDGEEMPASMDSLMLALARRLGASGFGKGGFGPGMDLNRPEQFYLKMFANIAAGDGPGREVAQADDQELALLSAARRHLPKAVFDESKWKAAVGERWWRRVVYLLNRGGRFEAADQAYKDGFAGHPWGNQLNIYVEPIGGGPPNSITGMRFSGVPVFQNLQSLDGKPVEFPPEYDLELFTYKEIFGGQSRTMGNYAGQMAISPENFVYVNAIDAARMALGDGDTVRLEGATFAGSIDLGPQNNSVQVMGKIKVIQGIRPGSVAVSWHYGHWAYGSRDVEIDGQNIPGEPARGKGLVPNAAMAVDGYLKDICLTDPIAGDSAFTGSRIRLVKVAGAAATPARVPTWASDF